MTTIIRTYNEMIQLSTFDERFNYLKLGGRVGRETFGFDRYLNQRFYNSKEWKMFRNDIIIRDDGCDLAMKNYDILDEIIIHHLNPIRIDDIINLSDYLLNPNYAVCTHLGTHNAIHYGFEPPISTRLVARCPNDTCPWK